MSDIMYLVGWDKGSFEEFEETNVFVTSDKEKAYKWKERFDRLVAEKKITTPKAPPLMFSNTYIAPDNRSYLWSIFHWEVPINSFVKEIEIR